MSNYTQCSRCGSNDFITSNVFVSGESKQVMKCRSCGKVLNNN